MTLRLVVSERAEADLRQIWLYTFDAWGEVQADRYLDELANGLSRCGVKPERGRERDDVRPGYRSVLVGKRLIFYQVTGDAVVVQRVLHGSMDPGLHVEDG